MGLYIILIANSLIVGLCTLLGTFLGAYLAQNKELSLPTLKWPLKTKIRAIRPKEIREEQEKQKEELPHPI